MTNSKKILLSERFKNDGKPALPLNPFQIQAIDIFRQDVKNGVYEFEKYNCECGAKYEELITIAEKDRYGLEVSTKICPRCGLLMTNPRMTQKSYDLFYDKICRKIYVGTESPTEEYFEKRKKGGEDIYEFLTAGGGGGILPGRIQSILDIGCGVGGVLAGLISRGMTKNVKGIDLDRDYLNFGREKGLDLEFGHPKDLLAKGEKFDLIILNHVFEHFMDVKSELEIISQLLSDEGLLFIEVPGFKNISIAGDYKRDFLLYLQNAHIRHFCRDTLSQVLRWNGFEEIFADEGVRGIYKKSAPDKTCINYYSDVLSSLQKIEEMHSKLRKYLVQEKNENPNSEMLTHVTFPFSSNIGDTVLSYCVRRTFDKLSEKNFSYFLLHTHQSLEDWILDKINSTKGIIIGGGGMFLPDTNENNITGWQWTCPKETLKKIIPPLIIYTVGYNYFKGQEPSQLFIDNLNAIVEKAAFVGLRNTGSVKKVQSLVRDDLKDKVVFQPCTTTVIRKIIPNLPKKVPTKKIGINMAFDRIDRRLGEHKEFILTQVAQAMKKIQSAGYEIYFINHCPSDMIFCKYLDEAGVQYNNVKGYLHFPNECFELYNEMDLVLGMRGHAQMIPFGLNTKIISLSSHDKMRWFLEDIDSSDWLVELQEQPKNLAERIFDKFCEIQSDKNVAERLIEQQNKLWNITVKNQEQIKNIINEFKEKRIL